MPDSATELLERPADDVTEVEAAAKAAAKAAAEVADVPPEEVVAADLLVEEISIDGMCGVY